MGVISGVTLSERKKAYANMCPQPTDHLVQGVGCSLSVVSVLRVVKVAALVIHAAALELAEEVEEAVFIGGVAAQLLEEEISGVQHKRAKDRH